MSDRLAGDIVDLQPGRKISVSVNGESPRTYEIAPGTRYVSVKLDGTPADARTGARLRRSEEGTA